MVAEGGTFGASETKSFSTPASCFDVFVNLLFDAYPADTSWDISRNGAVVARSSEYATDAIVGEETVCLREGEYTFTIYDAYLDGICCKWGQGSYSVTASDNVVIKEGGEFGASESTLFSLPTK